MEAINFCEYSQTFRTYPENFWVGSIKNGELVNDSWDNSGNKYFHLLSGLIQNIEKTREEHKKLQKEVVYKTEIKRIACIVWEKVGGFGVQYWTEWQIKNRISLNSDKTISYFIVKL